MYSTERDEREAIDKSNILKGDRTRHAKPVDTYKEPSDEQGLPKTVLDGTDGMSSTRWVVLGQEGVGNTNYLKGLMYFWMRKRKNASWVASVAFCLNFTLAIHSRHSCKQIIHEPYGISLV